MIDGEAVIENANGIPDLGALRDALGARETFSQKVAREAVFYASTFYIWTVMISGPCQSNAAGSA
jgi:ATP-dependent DNA ligase